MSAHISESPVIEDAKSIIVRTCSVEHAWSIGVYYSCLFALECTLVRDNLPSFVKTYLFCEFQTLSDLNFVIKVLNQCLNQSVLSF